MYPAEEVWQVLPREGFKACGRRFRRFFREKKMEPAKEHLLLPLAPFSSPNTSAEEASSRRRTSSSTSSTKQQQCRLS